MPSTAVKSSTDGTKYVQILQNGAPTNVTVETGMSGDSYIEITSGLTEGQEIITATSTASKGGTTATTTPRSRQRASAEAGSSSRATAVGRVLRRTSRTMTTRS